MLMDGILMGVMTFVGFSVCYSRLPNGVKLFAQRHPLFTDVLMVAFFYGIMGTTLMAHFACATMSILTMAGLHIARHKEEFQFIWDYAELAKSAFNKGMNSLKEMGNKHKVIPAIVVEQVQ